MSKKKPKSKPRKPAPRPSSRTPARKAAKASRPLKVDPIAVMFEQAVGLAGTKHYFDAITVFDRISKEDKKAEYADDALFNAGLCYMQMQLYHDALAYFARLIQAYPNATIHAANGAKEVGRTAAKAHLGVLHCSLALGQLEDAKRALEALKSYSDSYVIDANGKKKTFYELGSETLAAIKPAS